MIHRLQRLAVHPTASSIVATDAQHEASKPSPSDPPPGCERYRVQAALLQQSSPGRDVRVVALPHTSSRLNVKFFTKDRDSFRERTGTDAEGAFHNARFAADVLGEVEDGRLTLA